MKKSFPRRPEHFSVHFRFGDTKDVYLREFICVAMATSVYSIDKRVKMKPRFDNQTLKIVEDERRGSQIN